jgi:D-threonate/D-erythronate kinase
MKLRIVADDLTGALDTAAPLAALAGPLPVLWERSAIPPDAASFALDTESRDAPPAAPAWLDAFTDADLAYKKIDSQLRGSTAQEIAACLASGRFASALIAPAFPAQQRVTRGGCQYWRPSPSMPWQPVPCDLPGALRASGVDLRLAASAKEVGGGGFFLCDARSEADLVALAAAGRRLAAPLLWVGSAGLARALAGAPAKSALPRLAPPLWIIIGSHHPVTMAQIEALKSHAREMVVEIRPSDALEPALAAVAGRERVALVMAVPDGTGAERAGPFFDQTLEALAARLPAPRSLVVTGGATLRRLVGVLGTRALLVGSEPLPGVPCSVLQGGLWDGAVMISKSGGFGEPRLLIRLADCVKG